MEPDLDRPATVAAILRWYDHTARDLPWRSPGAGAWAVMVSEFMLQQTPVARVLEPWRRWLERWPDPAALAAAPTGEAVRAWGRLGYPRRALRLHAAATAITDHHDGVVPAELDQLRALPGVGDYTAAAIASFAYRRRHVVLDTNVRRVLARLEDGTAHPAGASVTRGEYDRAAAWLPRSPDRAARWGVAAMELGALICTARSPACDRCPVRRRCRWYAAGRPVWDGPPRVGQAWHGTDRQCRGVLLAAVRDTDEARGEEEVLATWSDRSQAERALAGLIEDRLLERTATGVRLPT